MKKEQRILITVIVGVILVVAFYIIASTITKITGYSVSPTLDKDAEFKDCLRKHDITLYINTNDPAFTLKNMELLDYLDSVKIVNCLRNNELCLGKQVTEFPSWIIEGNKLGEVSLTELSELSGCNLN